MIKLDVVCPLYLAEDSIEALLRSIGSQKQIELGTVVFPITKAGNTEAVTAHIDRAGFRWFFVNKEDFSHSLTREKAIYEYCTSDIVIMMSQDVGLTTDLCFFELAKHISGSVVHAYGRQICKEKTIEYYTRLGNYGPQTKRICAGDIEKLQLRAFSSSDAFAAYNRNVFVELGGFDHIHMMFNEDMYFVKKLLEAGYEKVYAADAVVEHSHQLTLKQLFNRYKASGQWFGEHPEFDGYKTTDAGLALALSVFKNALRDFNIPVLVRFVPDMLARYLGMKAGKRRCK